MPTHPNNTTTMTFLSMPLNVRRFAMMPTRVLVARSESWLFLFLADAVCARSAEFLAEDLAPSWAVRVWPRFGGHFPGRYLRLFLGGHFRGRDLSPFLGNHLPGRNLRLYLGDHLPGRNLRLYLGRVGLLRANRCLLATFLSPA